VAKKGLCLSGGGARGSFQIGAIKCLYEAFGYRPDILASTSVGSVNGIKLAEAPPPTDNNAAKILSAMAAGTVDPPLAVMRQLEQLWLDFQSSTDFFVVRQPFKGTAVEDAIQEINSPSFGGPLNTTVNRILDVVSIVVNIPFAWDLALLGVPIAGAVLAVEIQKFRGLIENLFTEDALLALDPIEALLRDPTNVDLTKVAQGTPLFMGAVSLETGRLRYIKGTGEMIERDGFTPVASALKASDIDSAKEMDGAAASAALRQGITDSLAAYKAQTDLIASYKTEYSTWNTAKERRAKLVLLIDLAKTKGARAYSILEARVAEVRVKATVDPIQGVLASACMPVYFVPPLLGLELYVDGGIREILPMEIARKAGATELIGILCSANELPVTDSMKSVGVLAVAARTLLETTLKEIVEGDIEAAQTSGLPTRIIAPTFDVHDTVVVQESLIEIAMDYGWLRAGDEMTAGQDAEHAEFRALSDHVTRLRLEALAFERFVFNEPLFAFDPTLTFIQLRVVRWAIWQIELARLARGLPKHPRSSDWSAGWEREIRGIGKPFASIWSRLEWPNGTLILNPSTPATFEPNEYCVKDEASDAIAWLVRGAAFHDPDSDSSRGPVVTLPPEVMRFLPKVPKGTLAISTVDNPAQVYLIRGGKRFPLTAAQLAQAVVVLAGEFFPTSVATVPRNGHLQIPDGGSPFFLANLIIVDSGLFRQVLEIDIDCVDQTTRTFDFSVKNRSTKPIAITGAGFVGVDAAAGLSINAAWLPTVVPPNTVDSVRLNVAPTRVGDFSGLVRIDCDDPMLPQILLPLTVHVVPLGEIAHLDFDPASLEISAAIANGGSGIVHIVNNGGRTPTDVTFSVAAGPGQAVFSLKMPTPTPAGFAPNARVALTVYFNPTEIARSEGAIELKYGGASSSGTNYTRTSRLPVVGLGGAGRIRFLKERPHAVPIGRGRVDVSGLFGSPSLEIDVGTISAPMPAAATFYVGNIGNRDLQLTWATASNPSASVQGLGSFPVIITPDQWLPLVVEVYMPKIGAFEITLSLQSDDPDTPVALVTVRGQGAGAAGDLKTDFLDFGAMGIGDTVTQSTAFENTGTLPLTLANEPRSQVIALFSSISPAVFPTTVLPGQSMPLSIRFGPSDVIADYTDTFLIKMNELSIPSALTVTARVR
jgi:hypothetical protein